MLSGQASGALPSSKKATQVDAGMNGAQGRACCEAVHAYYTQVISGS
jgi:hypothetical protein